MRQCWDGAVPPRHPVCQWERLLVGDVSLPSLLSCWGLEQAQDMPGMVAWARLSWTSEEGLGYSKDISVETRGALRIQEGGWQRRST